MRRIDCGGLEHWGFRARSATALCGPAVGWNLLSRRAARVQSLERTLLLDNIDEGTRTNGTAVLTIAFSDGSQGVLTIGCHGPGAPPGIFEGIATTKGYVTYYDVQAPTGGVDANRTIFHVRR